ncbi:hypothetical protein M758_4G129100 [Ceratodon purpureus]|nr:hypothetical protein M758_4G129100 [Ceratodon purpureus]
MFLFLQSCWSSSLVSSVLRLQLATPEARGDECRFKRQQHFVSFHTMCTSSSSLSRVFCWNYRSIPECF